MSEYIQREEAEKIFVEYNCVKYHVAEMGDTNEANRIILMFRENAKKLFSIAPSADVAPVIRCKDCKWFDKQRCVCHNLRYGDGYANYQPPNTNDEYWCAFGERKNDE